MKSLPFAALLIPFGIVIYFGHLAGYPINHDSGILIHMAQVLIRGGTPYIDVIEPNGPLVGWVHAVPVLISKALSLPVPGTFQLFVTMLLVFSCWQIWTLLGALRPPFSASKRMVFLGLWLLGTLPIQFVFDYGQREHLFALLLLPWVLCRLARYRGASLLLYQSVALGIIASPLFLLKPYFLAVVLGIELLLIARNRIIRPLLTPEAAVLGVWGLAYFVYLMTLPPEAKNDLFHRWIPFLIQHYKVYNFDLLAPDNISTYVWMSGVLVVAFLARHNLPANERHSISVLGIATALCFGAYLAQGKGWYYHHIPPRMLSTSLLAFVLCSESRGNGPSRVRNVTRAAAMVLALLPVIVTFLDASDYRLARMTYVRNMTAKIRQYAAPGEAVEFITSNVRRNYPSVVYAGSTPGSRYQLDFVIPMVYHGMVANPKGSFPYRMPSDQTNDERRYLEELAEDIAEREPKLIAVDADPDCQACPPGFRIDEYLRFNGWQEQAMSQYRFVESYDTLLLFVLE